MASLDDVSSACGFALNYVLMVMHDNALQSTGNHKCLTFTYDPKQSQFKQVLCLRQTKSLSLSCRFESEHPLEGLHFLYQVILF